MNKVEKSDLIEFFQIFKKRIKLILILPILFAIVSGVINWFFIKPTYVANVSIILGMTDTLQIDPQAVNKHEAMVNTYIQISKVKRVAENAANILNNGTTAEQLAGSFNITAEKDTSILTMSVKSNNPKEATDRVNALAEAYVKEGNSIISSGKMEIMEKAEVPASPIAPQKFFNISIAFLIGLMISIGIAFFKEQLNRTIKDENDVEKYLEIPVIGLIPTHEEGVNK